MLKIIKQHKFAFLFTALLSTFFLNLFPRFILLPSCSSRERFFDAASAACKAALCCYIWHRSKTAEARRKPVLIDRFYLRGQSGEREFLYIKHIILTNLNLLFFIHSDVRDPIIIIVVAISFAH